MLRRLFCLLLASAFGAFAQSVAAPSTPLTYFFGRGPAWTSPKAVVAGPGGEIWVAGETYGNSLPAGVRVMIGDRPAPLLYVSEGQVNAVTPRDLGEHPLVSVRVERGGATSNVLAMTTDSVSPAIFSTDSGLGPNALAINADGTLNSPDNPAPRGSIVTVFATGVGPFSPPLADGEVAPLEPPFPTLADAAGIEFEFGPTQVTYAGAAPGVVAGVAQFNLTVPTDGPDGDRYIYVKTTTGSTSASFRLSVGP